MEFCKCKRKVRAPLPIFSVIALFVFQLWAVTAQTTNGESSVQSSVNSTSVTSSRFLLSSPSEFSFKFKWRGTRRRNKVNKASREYLFAHNLVRARVGEPPLEWDGRLAAYARAWAKQRVGDCKLAHSYGPFGENIFWAGDTNWKPSNIVKVWADEDRFYHMKDNTCEPNQMCGHYTQIVWRDSTNVGCANVDCTNGGLYAICVYNPPGNFEGENPFGSYEDQSGLSREEPPAVIG